LWAETENRCEDRRSNPRKEEERTIEACSIAARFGNTQLTGLLKTSRNVDLSLVTFLLITGRKTNEVSNLEQLQ
jgi:hypothetical protein